MSIPHSVLSMRQHERIIRNYMILWLYTINNKAFRTQHCKQNSTSFICVDCWYAHFSTAILWTLRKSTGSLVYELMAVLLIASFVRKSSRTISGKGSTNAYTTSLVKVHCLYKLWQSSYWVEIIYISIVILYGKSLFGWTD